MKKADTAALDRWEDVDYYSEWNGGPPYDELFTGWKFGGDYGWRLSKKAYENDANWDWEENNVQHLDLPEWCKEWQKIESESQFRDQIKLFRIKEKQFVKEQLKKSMQKELEKIIKDFPTSKACYDSYFMIIIVI